MNYAIEPIRIERLNDVVVLLNGSSCRMPSPFRLNTAGFLALSRFWNFSYGHSFIGYVEGEPAGVVLNMAEPDRGEAFSFYWGVLPKFRGRRISMALAYAFLDRARAEGYRRAYANTANEGNLELYRKLGYEVAAEYWELEAERAFEPCGGYDIRPLSAGEWAEKTGRFPAPHPHWAQRPEFVRNAGMMLEIYGAFDRGGRLAAGAVLSRWPGSTAIVDLRCNAGESACSTRSLLAYLETHNFPHPFTASFVERNSPVLEALEQAGFSRRQKVWGLTLDLSAYRPRHLNHRRPPINRAAGADTMPNG